MVRKESAPLPRARSPCEVNMKGWSQDNPLDNAQVVIAAQLLAALLPATKTEEEVAEAVSRAIWATDELLSQRGWGVP